MIGALSSVPTSDQVPELMNAVRPDAATDATAEPVSWVAGATTGVPASAAHTSALRGPTIDPGSIIGGNIRVGISRSANNPRAQSRVLASTNCVVVAIVNSPRNSPVSQ